MRVCIDIQPAIAQRAGVGRYTKSLVEHLGNHAGADELAVFYFDFKRRGADFSMPHADHRAVRWLPGRLAQWSWKTLDWPPFDAFAGPADLYHFPNFIRPPLTRGRSVVTIHDVSFLRFPETTEERNLRYLTRRIHHTVETADAIITDSRFSADEIAELLGVQGGRLFPIPLGLPPGLARPGDDAVRRTREALGLQRPYLLTVGTLEPRKNVSFLVDVFEKLRGFDGDLVVAGMPGWKHEPMLHRMRTSTVADRICYLKYVDERHLAALYAGAELLVFPSLYEGFGFPPLEAMACGTPVVASNAGSLPEVLGEAALVVAGYDAEQWAERIAALLGDTARLDALRVRGDAHHRQFSWDACARRTWDVYREVCG